MSNVKIRIRAMEPEDLDTLYEIENDTDIWDAGVTNVPYSRFALHQYLENASSDIFADKQVRLMIDDGIANEPVGIVDVMNFDPRHKRAELGIVVKRQQRNKGYASAAIAEVAKYCRETIHLHQLYVLVSEDNKVSLHLFDKHGFKSAAVLEHWLFDGEKYRNAVVMQLFL